MYNSAAKLHMSLMLKSLVSKLYILNIKYRNGENYYVNISKKRIY